MALSHVCIWDGKSGYRRITAEEASKIYLGGIPANAGVFICELCGQNVGLTAPGKNIRHFRHTSATQNKECEERQKEYKYALKDISSHPMPIKILVDEINKEFSFSIGFFRPAHNAQEGINGNKIIIKGVGNINYEYSFERIEVGKTTYLNVGSNPQKFYSFYYDGANSNLRKYWPTSTSGIDKKGAFFECDSGNMLRSGSKASSNKEYYLIQNTPIYDSISRLVITKILHNVDLNGENLYLYKIKIEQFSQSIAKFFFRKGIFLTPKAVEVYPIWPACVINPFIIYHNEKQVFIFSSEGHSKIKIYPNESMLELKQIGSNDLYKIKTERNEHLVSIGGFTSGTFSYLIKRKLNLEKQKPKINIIDRHGNEFEFEGTDGYLNMPRNKEILIVSEFDGRIEIFNNKHIVNILSLNSNENKLLDNLEVDYEIKIYQGCDLVKVIKFLNKSVNIKNNLNDKDLLKKLSICKGREISISHGLGSIVYNLKYYPCVKVWLQKKIRRGKIPFSALNLLLKYCEKIRRVNNG